MIKSHTGISFMLIGIVLIAFAALIVTYNVYEDKKSGNKAKQIVEYIKEELYIPELTENTILKHDNNNLSLFQDNSNDNILYYEGTGYIGILQIPQLDIELPVANEWSYSGLKNSPCRYSGSAYDEDFIIAAHNYSEHFGKIGKLVNGDEVRFISFNGDINTYYVSDVELLDESNIEEMVTDKHALTLFTCDLSGKKRITVRCSILNNTK